MADSTFKNMDVYGREPYQGEAPLDLSRSSELREQLVEEIRALEARLAEIEDGDDQYDFSLQQTCREMIHSRARLFRQLLR